MLEKQLKNKFEEAQEKERMLLEKEEENIRLRMELDKIHRENE
jgi:hypothetical protein